jgi:hypothetical protein
MADPLGLMSVVVLSSGADDLRDSGKRLAPYYGGPVKYIKGLFGPNLKGVSKIVLLGHGNQGAQAMRVRSFWDRLLGRKGKLMNGREMAEYLRKKGFTGTEVVVVSCHMGQTGGFGQELANGLGSGANVEAWPSYTAVDGNGRVRMHVAGPTNNWASYAGPGQGSNKFQCNLPPTI